MYITFHEYVLKTSGNKILAEREAEVAIAYSPILERIVLGQIERHFKNKALIRHSQHEFIKGKTRLSNLISFYDKVTLLVVEGKDVDVIFLDVSKAFDTVPHGIFLDELSNCEVTRFTLYWVMNWLNGRTQRVLVNGATFGW